MYISLDLTTLPPTVTLEEPDDFKAFKVVARGPGEHLHVAVDELKRLAGDRASDPAWVEQLDGMLGYAASKGWIREDGAVRAHVEPAA